MMLAEQNDEEGQWALIMLAYLMIFAVKRTGRGACGSIITCLTSSPELVQHPQPLVNSYPYCDELKEQSRFQQ